jgi:hypothetical protein
MKRINLPYGGIREMLSREQMKQIIGGYETSYTCYLSGKDASGNAWSGTVFHPDGTSCSNQSSSTNNLCVDYITQSSYQSCKYDCACDGIGV